MKKHLYFLLWNEVLCLLWINMPMISGRNKNKNVIVACMRTCHACSIDFDLITKNNGPSKTKKGIVFTKFVFFALSL